MERMLWMTMAWLAGGVALHAGEGKVVFEDSFEGKLKPGWKWIREVPEAWRLRDGALEIKLMPGDAQTVRNALVRPAPDRRTGRYALELTVRNLTVPTEQYEQAGITWYHNGQPVFKLVKERVNGQLMIIPGRKPMTEPTVQLRLVVAGRRFTAQYRPGGRGAWQTAAQGELPPPGRDEVSIQGYHGPPNAAHWIRFDDFRIVRLED